MPKLLSETLNDIRTKKEKILYLKSGQIQTAEEAVEVLDVIATAPNLVNMKIEGLDNCLDKKELIQALSCRKDLQVINISNSNIGDEGTKDLCDALLNNKHLETINLHGNKITAKGITEVANLVKQNSSVKRINIGYNPIGDSGAEILAPILEKPQLVDLVLNDIRVSSRGINTIFTALRSNTVLEGLDFSINKVDTLETAKTIANMLESSSLKELGLNRILDMDCHNKSADISTERKKILDGVYISTDKAGVPNYKTSGFNDEIGFIIINALIKHTTLEKFHFASNLDLNGIKTYDAVIIMIKENPALKYFQLAEAILPANILQCILNSLENSRIEHIKLDTSSCWTQEVTTVGSGKTGYSKKIITFLKAEKIRIPDLINALNKNKSLYVEFLKTLNIDNVSDAIIIEEFLLNESGGECYAKSPYRGSSKYATEVQNRFLAACNSVKKIAADEQLVTKEKAIMLLFLKLTECFYFSHLQPEINTEKSFGDVLPQKIIDKLFLPYFFQNDQPIDVCINTAISSYIPSDILIDIAYVLIKKVAFDYYHLIKNEEHSEETVYIKEATKMLASYINAPQSPEEITEAKLSGGCHQDGSAVEVQMF